MHVFLHTSYDDHFALSTDVRARISTNCMLKNSQMKTLILCLYIARVVAWPPGVYILVYGTDNQFYDPLTEPHSQLNLNINFRGDQHRVTENVVAEIKCAPLVARNGRRCCVLRVSPSRLVEVDWLNMTIYSPAKTMKSRFVRLQLSQAGRDFAISFPSQQKRTQYTSLSAIGGDEWCRLLLWPQTFRPPCPALPFRPDPRFI